MLGVPERMLMAILREALEIDAFDTHVLAHSVELPPIQACSDRPHPKKDLGDEAVVVCCNVLKPKDESWKEQTHQPTRRGELDAHSFVDAGETPRHQA